METLRKSRNTTTVIAANGEVQTSEEAPVNVHDLDLFVTVQILDDTPAVMSSRKVCGEHGSANEWAGGQKPHLTRHGKRFLCKTENFVRVVVPGLPSSSSASSSTASFQQDSSSTSPSPASLRSDDTHDQASGTRGDPSEIKKTTDKKKGNNQATSSRLRDLPGWSEQFKMISKMTEDSIQVPALANTFHDSDSEHPTKVASRKQSVDTHFPKDRNCKVCKRTKITRALRRKRTGEAVLRAEKFDDLITADHKVFNEGGESGNNHRYAILVQDLATQCIQSYPCNTKTSQETERSLRSFSSRRESPKSFAVTIHWKFGKSCEDVSWNRCTLSFRRSEKKGIAERAARRIKRRDVCSIVATRLG